MLPWPLWMPMSCLLGDKVKLGLECSLLLKHSDGKITSTLQYSSSTLPPPLSQAEKVKKKTCEEDQKEYQEARLLACLPEASGRGEGAAAHQANASACCCVYFLQLTSVRA